MAHSNQVREFLLTSNGVDLLDIYTGPGGAMTGALRAAQEARERAQALEHEQEIQRMQRELARERQALEAKISLLQSEFEAREDSLERAISQAQSAKMFLPKSAWKLAGSARPTKQPLQHPSHRRALQCVTLVNILY